MLLPIFNTDATSVLLNSLHLVKCHIVIYLFVLYDLFWVIFLPLREDDLVIFLCGGNAFGVQTNMTASQEQVFSVT